MYIRIYISTYIFIYIHVCTYLRMCLCIYVKYISSVHIHPIYIMSNTLTYIGPKARANGTHTVGCENKLQYIAVYTSATCLRP